MIRISGFPRCWIEEISSGEMAFFDWLEDSAELECEGLEIYWRFIESQASAYLADVRRRIERHGRTMSMMCFSPDFTLPDERARAEQVELQKTMIRVTAELGGKFCRTLSGQRRPGVSVKQGLDRVVRCIESCLPVAEC